MAAPTRPLDAIAVARACVCVCERAHCSGAWVVGICSQCVHAYVCASEALVGIPVSELGRSKRAFARPMPHGSASVVKRLWSQVEPHSLGPTLSTSDRSAFAMAWRAGARLSCAAHLERDVPRPHVARPACAGHGPRRLARVVAATHAHCVDAPRGGPQGTRTSSTVQPAHLMHHTVGPVCLLRRLGADQHHLEVVWTGGRRGRGHGAHDGVVWAASVRDRIDKAADSDAYVVLRQSRAARYLVQPRVAWTCGAQRRPWRVGVPLRLPFSPQSCGAAASATEAGCASPLPVPFLLVGR
jgi:hypothetical protein